MSAKKFLAWLPTRFAPDVERVFQKENYENTRSYIRGASFLFFLMGLGHIFRFVATQPREFLVMPLGVMAVWSMVFGLTFWRRFWEVWQPVLTVLLLAAFSGLEVGAAHNIRVEPGYGDLIARVSWFSASTMMFMVALAPIRVGFCYAVIIYSGLASVCGLVCLTLYAAPLTLILDRFSLGLFVVLPTLIYLSYSHERLHRAVFSSRQIVAEKEAEERRRRVHTESMLHILGNAIGGIVHDLGTPLTMVQSGLEVLDLAVSRGRTDSETLVPLITTLKSGASMLGYLRISLIEQTRVLEGKPIPVTPAEQMLSSLVETGLRFQNPMYAQQRSVVVAGEDVRVQADAMKMGTAFMNLVGNALKYSDGEVKITWITNSGQVYIAVQDQGVAGRGLTMDQAASLFVPFGRLDAHQNVEGTGLGLVSVQKIVEAHGGETYIEGRGSSGTFSTAAAQKIVLLQEGFATAFVVRLPLAA